MTAREGTTARPDGARVVGKVLALPTMDREPGFSLERNAFELGRDYQRGQLRNFPQPHEVRQALEALEAEIAELTRRMDRLETDR